MTPASGFATPRAAYGWRRALAYALLWTVVVAALENFLPISVLSPPEAAAFLAGGAGWLFAGVLFSTLAAFAVPRLPVPQLLLAAAGVAVFITLLRLAAPNPFLAVETFKVRPSTANAHPVYLAWGTLLYGTLFVAATSLAHRAERTRERLAQAEIARSDSEKLFNEAELAGAQGSVDPALLLRAVAEMERRYRSDAAGADRLLDQLVGFLRLAMPGVRSGKSTLGAELAVARSCAALGAELDPQRGAWRCEIDDSLAPLAFPPLLLLPLLDQLAAAQPGPLPHTLTVVRGESQILLTLHAKVAPGWLADDLLHRLRVGLRAAHPDARVLVAVPRATGAAALTMTFPFDALRQDVGTAQPIPPLSLPSQPTPPPDAGARSPWTSQHTRTI